MKEERQRQRKERERGGGDPGVEEQQGFSYKHVEHGRWEVLSQEEEFAA